MPEPALRQAGFTLVELITVLVLAGVLSAFAMGRLSPGAFQAVAFAEEVRAALRFAQKFALASGCQVQATVDGGSDSYALQLRADATGPASSCLAASGAFGSNPLVNPATGAAYAGTAPAQVDVSGALAVVFDAAGRPGAGASVSVAGQTLSVQAETGLVR